MSVRSGWCAYAYLVITLCGVSSGCRTTAGGRCTSAADCEEAGLLCITTGQGRSVCKGPGMEGDHCAEKDHCQGALACAPDINRCEDLQGPRAWVRRLRDAKQREVAAQRLWKMVKNARTDEQRSLLAKVALADLCAAFKARPDRLILRSIAALRDRRAIPTLVGALDFVGEEHHNATVAARALAELKAVDAVDALGKVLDRPLVKQSRANLAKLAAIEALGKIGDPRAVPYLEKCARKHWQRDDQDFLLNRKAIEALGKIGDPRAVDTLVLGLFMTNRRGHSFNQARLALVRIGKPAIKPLINALLRKNKDLEKMAVEEELDTYTKGVIVTKTAITLGDLRAKEAVPHLLKILGESKVTGEYTRGLDGVIEGLGKIGDDRALPVLHKLIKHKKTSKMLKMYISSALMTIGSEKSLPVLLRLAEEGDIPGRWNGKPVKDPEVRGACARIYAQMVGKDAVTSHAKLEALSKEKRLEGWAARATFVESLKLMKMAAECKDDALCYGKKLEDTNLKPAERIKAAVMIGRLPNGRKAIPSLTRVLNERDNPLLRMILLLSATRIVTAADTAFVKELARVEARDARRKKRFTGGTWIHNSIALELIKRRGRP